MVGYKGNKQQESKAGQSRCGTCCFYIKKLWIKHKGANQKERSISSPQPHCLFFSKQNEIFIPVEACRHIMCVCEKNVLQIYLFGEIIAELQTVCRHTEIPIW